MIQDLLNGTKQTISLEVFPPKKEDEFEAAFTLMDKFGALKPDYISCTYGAGGSKSKKTTEICAYIQNQLHIDALAHLTCVGSTKESIDSVTKEYRTAGIKHILALRGDIPEHADFPLPNQFHHASELIAEIKSRGDFCIGGACYPEGHPESRNQNEDLDFLKEKVDAGCDYLTTQMFFDNHIYYNFMYKALKKGIDVPVVAGIMPVTNASQIKRIVSLSGNLVPAKFLTIVDRFGDHPEAMKQAGIAYATEQIIDLIANGVNHVHIYAMNKPEIVEAIMNNLSYIYVRE